MLGFLFFANPIAYSGLKLAAEMRHAMVGLRGEAHDIVMVVLSDLRNTSRCLTCSRARPPLLFMRPSGRGPAA